jgi:hypothetical protein
MTAHADTLTHDASLQILEIRAAAGEHTATITAAISASAIQAICTALSEQLDRDGQAPIENAEGVQELREHRALIERFEPLAAARAHAVVSFSQAELDICLQELTGYVRRADGEGYQTPDLRDRLRVIDLILPMLSAAQTEAGIAAAAPDPQD